VLVALEQTDERVHGERADGAAVLPDAAERIAEPRRRKPGEPEVARNFPTGALQHRLQRRPLGEITTSGFSRFSQRRIGAGFSQSST